MNRAEGPGALQYIPANAVLFSHVVESWNSTNTRNLFFGRQNHFQPITVLILVLLNGHSLLRQTDLVMEVAPRPKKTYVVTSLSISVSYFLIFISEICILVT